MFKYNQDRKYYNILKKETPPDIWSKKLEEILKILKNQSLFGVNKFKADILIDHNMIDELWIICKNLSSISVAEYEEYFKPKYNNEILGIYMNYIQEKALNANKEDYKTVAQFLKKVNTFKNGKFKADKLIKEFRIKYKRRPYMMKELDGL